MEICTEYFYSLANVSLTLRLIEYLQKSKLPIDSVIVINELDRWLVKVKIGNPLSVIFLY